MLRNRGGHELTDDAGKVGWHQEGFQPFDFLRVKLAVDKSQEVDESLHRLADVVRLHTVGNLRVLVEAGRFDWDRLTGSRFLAGHVSTPFRGNPGSTFQAFQGLVQSSARRRFIIHEPTRLLVPTPARRTC